jgi:hypothetical protein
MARSLFTELDVAGGTKVEAEVPDAVVAVYTTETDLTDAIKHLERAGCAMARISILGKGMNQDRHLRFDPENTHTARWAKWGGLWGWTLGAFIVIPPTGPLASGSPLERTLTREGIPENGLGVYVADLRAERFLMIAYGIPGDIDRVHELLGQATHERLDRHRSTAPRPLTPDHEGGQREITVIQVSPPVVQARAGRSESSSCATARVRPPETSVVDW